MTSTPELLARLQRHYIKPGAPLPGGVFLPEVGWNGAVGSRCDALYVGFTSTSGRTLIGHELKISRADWLHELGSLHKADAWADQCHEWWLVVSDPDIVAPGELPAGWGLMSPGKSVTRMQMHHKPDRKPATHQPSWNAVRSILARQDTLRATSISNIQQRAREEAFQANQSRIEDEVDRRMRAVPDAKRLRDRMDAIEKALGRRIDTEQSGRSYGQQLNLDDLRVIGQAATHARDLHNALDNLTRGYTLDGIRKNLETLEKSLAAIKALAAESEGAEHG